MTKFDDDRPLDDGVRNSGTVRPTKVVAGVLSLATLFGGAHLIISEINGQRSTVAQGTVPLAPAEPSAYRAPSTPSGSAGESGPAAPASGSVSASSRLATAETNRPTTKATAEDSEGIRKEIRAAREAAAKDGHPLQRPLGAARATAAASETSRTLPDGGIMRVISAKADLSGHRQMLWAADDGKPVNGARCTQNFHFSQNGKAAVRPTMLLCWRISTERSVVVLTVARKGRPSTADSVAAIDREWTKLG